MFQTPIKYRPLRSDYDIFNAAKRANYNPGYTNPGDPVGHKGPDLYPDPPGQPDVLASAAGKVRTAGQGSSDAGLMVEILHRIDGVDWLTRYLHLDSITVRVGDQVAAGQKIGVAGRTGNANAIHVHFEARRDGNPASIVYGSSWGVPVDPVPLFSESGGGGAGGQIVPTVWPAVLGLNDRDPAVKVLKTILVGLSGRGRVGNDFYGKALEAEVRDFQAAVGLTVDGRCGPATRSALADILNLEA